MAKKIICRHNHETIHEQSVQPTQLKMSNPNKNDNNHHHHHHHQNTTVPTNTINTTPPTNTPLNHQPKHTKVNKDESHRDHVVVCPRTLKRLFIVLSLEKKVKKVNQRI